MTDVLAEHPAPPAPPRRMTRTERRQAWERALTGPPLNPHTELIFYDGTELNPRSN